jgi:hypothetical protein
MAMEKMSVGMETTATAATGSESKSMSIKSTPIWGQSIAFAAFHVPLIGVFPVVMPELAPPITLEFSPTTTPKLTSLRFPARRSSHCSYPSRAEALLFPHQSHR